MRALVVYESMYGNTRAVAGDIADGLRADYEVTVRAGGRGHRRSCSPGPISWWPAARPTCTGCRARRPGGWPAQAAAKDGSELRLDPDAGGPGMRDWLKDLGHGAGLAAAFDTRINGVPAFTGRASRPIAKLLKRHGYRLVAAPESFLVSSQSTLLDGEADRARRWGMTLGAASKTYLPAHA